MKGIIKTNLSFNKYGVIEGLDNKKYFLHKNNLKFKDNKEVMGGKLDPYGELVGKEVEFTPGKKNSSKNPPALDIYIIKDEEISGYILSYDKDSQTGFVEDNNGKKYIIKNSNNIADSKLEKDKKVFFTACYGAEDELPLAVINDNEVRTMVKSPYNFVPFSEKVYYLEKIEDLVSHNVMSDQYHTGTINYNITAKSPIFVGGEKDKEGEKQFYSTQKGEKAIPGSTIRGLVRSNSQILGLGALGKDIDDYKLMYRSVASGYTKNEYESVIKKENGLSVPVNVKAGYIANEGGKYRIYKTENNITDSSVKINYYRLKEKEIRDNKSSFSYLTRDHREIIQNKQGVFLPGYIPVSYYVDRENKIKEIMPPGSKGLSEGVLCTSGPMKGKKTYYIIQKKKDEYFDIPDEVIREFKKDYMGRKNKLTYAKNENFRSSNITRSEANEHLQKFFALPDEGEVKPVFYVKEGEGMSFGFAPHTRVFFNHSIKDGIPKAHKEEGADLVDSIFGFTGKRKFIDGEVEEFKGKVSFKDALLVNNLGEEGNTCVNLQSPKPTACIMYITQDGNNKEIKTYNSDEFELRGVKQYWMHKDIKNLNKNMSDNEKIQSYIKPLKEGSRFRGCIKFKNLTDVELGLLLWSIKLSGDTTDQNIGGGKPFGFGRIHVDIDEVKVKECDKAYKINNFAKTNFYKDIDIDMAISKYKKEMKLFLGREIDSLLTIREFMHLKDINKIPESDDIEYMTLEEFEQQNKKISKKKNEYTLPSASDV